MAASLEEVNEWIERGKEIGATHIISVCDTFSYEDYPIFVTPGQNLNELITKYAGLNMQRVNEVIDLKPEEEIPTLHESDTVTIIEALWILARDIRSDDGVANAAIEEAATRLEKLNNRVALDIENVNDLIRYWRNEKTNAEEGNNYDAKLTAACYVDAFQTILVNHGLDRLEKE